MPARFANSPLSKLLPAKLAATATNSDSAQNDDFLLALSAEGMDHTVMQLDPNHASNGLAWSGVPELHYRAHGLEVPPGAAQVLAYAVPLNDALPWETAASTKLTQLNTSPSALVKRSEELARMRDEYIRRNALVVTQPAGAGRVCLLLFDSTWRLRYRTGDSLHHRFWGQVLRWATANKLPHGNDLVRLGTDHVVYTPGAAPQVRVSLRDAKGQPLSAEGVHVLLQQGEGKPSAAKLSPYENLPGIYEATLTALGGEGTYRVSLEADEGVSAELAQSLNKVSAEIVSIKPASPEMLAFSADATTLSELAKQTGGIVVAPHEAGQVLEHLGQPTGEISEQLDYPLWRSWPVLLIVVSLVTSEWLLRKRAGLT